MELHLRISRRFVFWAVTILLAFFVVLPLLWLALQTLGGSGHK